MIGIRHLGLSAAAVAAITAFGIGTSSAVTLTSPASFTFTSDDCSGGCGPNGQGSTNNNFGSITATIDSVNTNQLDFSVMLIPTFRFLSGNGAGIAASFALDFNGVSSITISNANSTFSNNNGAQSAGSHMMDGEGTFNYILTCNTCSPSSPDGQLLSFDVTSTGLTGAQLLADLHTGSGGSWFAADVNGSTGNTGVIDATLGAVPIPGALPLFGTVLFGGVGLARWRKGRRSAVAAA
jgi:hypothetical protein